MSLYTSSSLSINVQTISNPQYNDIIWGWKILVTEFFFSAKTSSWGLKTQKKNWGGGGGEKVFFSTKFVFFKNVPGVLKRMHKIYLTGHMSWS